MAGNRAPIGSTERAAHRYIAVLLVVICVCWYFLAPRWRSRPFAPMVTQLRPLMTADVLPEPSSELKARPVVIWDLDKRRISKVMDSLPVERKGQVDKPLTLVMVHLLKQEEACKYFPGRCIGFRVWLQFHAFAWPEKVLIGRETVKVEPPGTTTVAGSPDQGWHIYGDLEKVTADWSLKW